MSYKWHEKFVRAIGVNIWAPEWYDMSIKNFDAEKIAETLKRCHADVGLTFQGFSQDHFGVSYFPTEHGHTHCNLSGHDHLREYQTAVKETGAKFFAYYCFQDKIIWDKYPDWRIHDKDGKTSMGDNFGYLCPNSPYRDHVILRMTEIAEKYKPDGWLFDMLCFPVCYCSYCKRKYRMTFGVNLPESEPDCGEEWRRFNGWRYNQLTEYYRELVSTIKNITPDTVFTHNAFALWNYNEWHNGDYHEALMEYDDVVTNIESCEYGLARYPDMIWKAGYYTRAFRGLSNDKPVWLQFGRFMYYRDYTSMSEHELALHAYSIITNGGCPAVIDNAFPDGSPDPVASERLEKVFKDINSKEQYLGYDSEFEFAALLYSKSSQDWFDIANPGKGVYGNGFIGAYKILLESHTPFQVISERSLTLEKLSKFKILILSDCVVMSDEIAEIIREYTGNGGSVVALGKTGMIDIDGNVRDDSELSDIFGVHFKGMLNYKTSFAVALDNLVCEGIDKRSHIPLRECYPERFDITSNAETVMLSEFPATEVVGQKRIFTYADDVAPGIHREPLAVLNEYGKGKCVYFGGNIARIYGIYGNSELRSAVRGAIKACAESPVQTDAPLFVETAVYRKDDKYILHLLNYATGQLRTSAHAGGYTAEQAIPVCDINMSIDLGGQFPKSIKLEDGTDIPYTVDGGYVRFNIPKLETHLLVVIGF